MARRVLTSLSVIALAWGALAFGSVYEWAYYPLGVACALIGVIALVVFRPSHAPIAGLSAGFAAIAAVMALQLAPLPPTVLARLSPATVQYLSTYDLSYGLPAVDGIAEASPNRPISIDPPRTRVALAVFAAFALFTLGLIALLSASGAMPIVRSVVAIGVVLALVGIIQYAVTGGATYTLKIYGFWTPEFRGAPFGPYVNRNHFAGWMLMGLPLAVAAALGAGGSFAGGGARRFIAWLSASSDAGQMQLMAGAALIMTLSVLMANSRSGFLGFAVAIGLATWVLLRRQKATRARAWIVVAAAVFVIGAAAWAGIDRLVGRVGTLGADSSNVAGRLDAWRDALTIARAFPLAGSGVNSFGAAMVEYQTANKALHFEQAHNDYLQLLAEGGVLLAVAVTATLVLFVTTVRRRFAEAPRHGTTYWARIGAVIGLVAIAVQSLVEFSLQLPGNAALLCALLAVAAHRSPNLRIKDQGADTHP